MAYTDAAGKCSPEATRNGNEDNFFVLELGNKGEALKQDEVTDLADAGLLMVVADGMGGMNAGEVASQIAVDTVRDMFRAERETVSKLKDGEGRCRFLEQIIKEADRRIKKDSKHNPEHANMGSTIIMAWLRGDELALSWCGDSRAYIFNNVTGLRLVSKDHSYVQELVDMGMLTYDQTFDHPQNNIVTRSLGDLNRPAKPESKIVKVGKGDIILLCSDGLSGVLRDRNTVIAGSNRKPEPNIEDIMRGNTRSMRECREALWVTAEEADWYDNVTAILCQLTDGPESPLKKFPVENVSNEGVGTQTVKKRRSFILPLILGLLLVVFGFVGGYLLGHCSTTPVQDVSAEALADSTASVQTGMDTPKPDTNSVVDFEEALEDEINVEENKRETTKSIEDVRNEVSEAKKKGKSDSKKEDGKNDQSDINQKPNQPKVNPEGENNTPEE